MTDYLLDYRTLGLVGGVLAILAAATTVGQRLRYQSDIGLNPALVESFNLRIRAWWLMCTVLAAAFLLGPASRIATVVLFGLISFWALREFITLTPTRLGDHRTLFWVFLIFTPVQYLLVGMGEQYYGLFTVLIPVYGFLFIFARVALAGDFKRFLERTAKIQAGLMVCVYCLSHAPALLSLEIKNYAGQNARLLFFFVLVVQLNDVLQYAWGKLLGRHVITPTISPNRTWEGFAGGVASTTLVGTALWWATPFEPWQAAGMSLVISIMGFAGGMTMSAIKRDRGVEDYGTLVVGHGGVLDRIDSICFASPVFYHLTRYFFAAAADVPPVG
jgi:phosphatidate cytidylyltransferase